MKIYLAENEFLVTKTLNDFLSALGHQVIDVGNAEDLPQHLEGNSGSDCVVLIPGNVFKRIENLVKTGIQSLCPKIAFVIVNDMPSSLPVDRAISLGVAGYLRKPIVFSELQLQIARIAG